MKLNPANQDVGAQSQQHSSPVLVAAAMNRRSFIGGIATLGLGVLAGCRPQPPEAGAAAPVTSPKEFAAAIVERWAEQAQIARASFREKVTAEWAAKEGDDAELLLMALGNCDVGKFLETQRFLYNEDMNLAVMAKRTDPLFRQVTIVLQAALNIANKEMAELNRDNNKAPPYPGELQVDGNWGPSGNAARAYLLNSVKAYRPEKSRDARLRIGEGYDAWIGWLALACLDHLAPELMPYMTGVIPAGFWKETAGLRCGLVPEERLEKGQSNSLSPALLYAFITLAGDSVRPEFLQPDQQYYEVYRVLLQLKSLDYQKHFDFGPWQLKQISTYLYGRLAGQEMGGHQHFDLGLPQRRQWLDLYKMIVDRRD